MGFDRVCHKPLTIIYDGARNLAENLLAEDGSVGIRVTAEEFSKQLCFRFRKAIVSTSANISGQPSPANFSEISEEVKQAVDYIVGIDKMKWGIPNHPALSNWVKGRSEDYQRIKKRNGLIDEDKKSWLQRFILWREKKIKEKHFILILSFLAGIFTALAAWFLKFLIEWIQGISD